MTHTYNISGMTCKGCVAKVKSELLKMGDISAAEVQLDHPQAVITMQKHVPTTTLQAALDKAGNYTITDTGHEMQVSERSIENKSWWQVYKPILLIFFYISTVTLLVTITSGTMNLSKGMNIFMSGFFLAFSFFKLLDLNGFADSYATYDIVAKKYRSWGFIYPFVELLLGLAYAVDFLPLFTNIGTFIVMSISIVGVLQSVLSKRKIQCACLGAVFNLPMSTVTIIEDALMIAMSGMAVLMLL